MKRVAKLGVLSVAYIQGLIGVGVGLIVGLLITSVSLLFGGLVGSVEGGEVLAGGMMFGAAAIIIMPIMYGIGGFVGGLVTALVYNLAAKISGGIVVELKDENSSAKPVSSDMSASQPQL